MLAAARVFPLSASSIANVRVQMRSVHCLRHAAHSRLAVSVRPPISREWRALSGAACSSEGRSAGEEHLQAIRESVRALCNKFDPAYWRELDAAESYPTEFVKAMQQAGFLSSLIPEEYGGSGLDLRAACTILETVHSCGANAAAAHAQMYTMGSILRHGSENQKVKYLPEIAAGELRLQAFGVTEATSGTNTMALKTTARLADDGSGDWIVDGSKIWTSRAEHSDLMLLLARTGESGTPRMDALTVFILDMRVQGRSLTIQPISTMMNHNSTSVFFDGCRVPAENVVGGVGNGFRVILGGMNAERILIASECIGDGKFLIERAVAYAKEREVFGKPIGAHQGVAFPIAEAYAQLSAAELMVEKAARLYDTGQPCGAEANLAKYLAAEASFKCADVAVQTLGGFGFAREYDVERKFRETRLYRVAPISTNLILAFVAEKVLGLPRSY